MAFLARPDCTILDDSIPLYFVGRNRAGLWVVCEHEGRARGIFPDEASAMRFARTQTGVCGCAVMLIPEGLDADLAPQAG
jgi:hypothetical protein